MTKVKIYGTVFVCLLFWLVLTSWCIADINKTEKAMLEAFCTTSDVHENRV